MDRAGHWSPSPIDALIDAIRADHQVAVERARKVYCNRDLNFEKIEAVGFDMDYTLARYKQDELDALSVELTLERLVTERGYPEEIKSIKSISNFAIRGLVVDTLRGNVLKMDAHRHVGKGYHGLRELTREERHEYRDITIRLNETNSRFMLIDTLYALPEAFMYAALVDYLEALQPQKKHDWKRLFDDIRYCIDLAHRDGSIKDEIMTDTERFIPGKDEELALTLHRIRSAGKRVFLLTNSYPTYSNHVMSHILDGVLQEYPSWRNYFEIIITGASKPTFFTSRNPFLRVDATGTVSGEEYQGFQRSALYQGGNLIDFERMSGMGGEKVVYVGDHIYGDIVRSKKSSAWRTVMIVQEMEAELDQAEDLRDEIHHLDEVDSEIMRISERITYEQNLLYQLEDLIHRAGDVDKERLQTARKELNKSKDKLRRLRKELIEGLDNAEHLLESNFNPYWGLVFRLANENTLFGEQVEDYACLYTSRVSNFINYSPVHYYRAPRQPMPHERY